MSSRLPAASLSLTMALVGCTGELAAPRDTQGGTAPRRGGTIRLASMQEVRSLDPATQSDNLSRQAALLLFSGLVTFDDNGKVIPDLAESWQVLEGGNGYLFHLRPHVLFHDGAEVTGADVQRSLMRALHPKTPNAFSSRFDALSGYEEYAKGGAPTLSGIVVEGRYDVRFRLSHPDSAFLSALALLCARPVCASAGGRYEDGWQPCGAGPFKLRQGAWVRGSGLTLERFADFVDADRIWLDSVTWTFNVGVLAQRFKFERGELDVLEDLTQADVARFRADPRWAPFGEVGAEAGIHGLVLNTEVPPFDNIEIRRAIANAIDRKQICLLKPANMSEATQPIIRGVDGFGEAPSGQSYNLEAALDHMRRAGYPFDPATGHGGYPVAIPYVVPGRSLEEAVAQVAAQQLAKIGIRVEVRSMSYAPFAAITHRRRAVAMSAQGWDLDTADPVGVFDPLFGSPAITEDDANNFAFYSNTTLDEMLLRGHLEQDEGKRRALYRQASALVADQAPWVFEFSWHNYVVHQPRLHGLHVHPVWQTEVAHAWLDPEHAPQ